MTGRFFRIVTLVSFLSWAFFSLLAFAYEVDTHEDISEAATRQSNLNDYLPNIGLASLDAVIETDYLNEQPRPATFWIRYGANHEDDLFSDALSGTRFLNHFYNPLTGAGLFYQPPLLSFCVTVDGLPAPDWALKEGEAASANQIFSFKDAREYFYRGLTEQHKNRRGQYLAMTFRALGQVMHLIQDMAQPQHTRNDAHGPGCYGGKSLYELYTDRDDVRPNPRLYIGYDAVYSSADTATFNTPRNFWHTADGKGIADYSNRGFVSAGTNFDTNLFSSPIPDSEWEENEDALCEKIHMPRPKGSDGQELPCVMTFIRAFVEDKYRSGTNDKNEKASTNSIFTADLKGYTNTKFYTLNRFTFDEAHKFLIPRAVGYSAGLINYFFRGQIDLVPDPANPAGYLIQNLGDEDLNGTFTLYYDDADGNRQEVPGAKWPVAVAKGQDMPVSAFTLPTDPAPQTSGEYMLVFTGELGEEKPVNGAVGAVVAKKITPASPFLLETSGGTYKSQSLDQGWERLGVEWFGPKWDGQYIKEDLLILDGALFQHVNEVWEWVDLYNSGVTSLGRITYMGGEELLAEGCVGDICGFLYSPDLGATWQLRAHDLDFPINSGLWYIGNGVVLTAGIPYTTGEGWALYKSTDQGGSWVRISPVTGGTNAKDQWVVGTMCWNQVEGAGSVILASGVAYTKEFGSTCGLWKSTDGGNTWRHLSTLADDCYTRVRSVALDPQDKALMVVGPYLNKSIDAGETWEAAETPDGSQAAGVLYLGNNLGVNEAQ